MERFSESIRYSEERLREALQEFLRHDDLPPSLKSGDQDWGQAEIGSVLEWYLLPAHLRLDPSWPHQKVWCDGVSFFSLERLGSNAIRGQCYSWWLPTDQKGPGGMGGIEHTELLELELSLIEAEAGPRLDYSINLWADGLCHQITPSGVSVAPVRSDAASQPKLAALLSVIRDREAYPRARSIAANFLGRWAPEGASLLAELMSSLDTETRCAVVDSLRLGGLDARLVVVNASRALNDPDIRVRCRAACALWKCVQADEGFFNSFKQATPVLLEMFRLEYDEYRDWRLNVSGLVQESLARIGQSDQRVVAAMLDTLRNGQTPLQAAAVLWGLDSIPHTAVPFFTEALKNESAELRVIAAFSLWKFGIDQGKAFVELVREIENVKASTAAAGLLGSKDFHEWIGAEAAVPVLTAILKERRADAWVWCRAALTLGQISARRKDENPRRLLLSIGPSLVRLLNYEDDHIRRNAAETLGEMGSDARPALPTLLAIVRDPHEDEFVRSAATEALIKIGLEADAAISLFHLLRQENAFGLYSNAVRMISHLGSQAVAVLVEELMATSPEREMRSHFELYALEFLEQVGPASLPGLIELLNSEEWRSSALRALGSAGAGAVPVLIEALQDERPETRASAAEALGGIGPAAAPAIPVLSGALNDPDLEVCARAAEALGRIGPASTPALIDALTGADSFTLCWAANALREIGPEADAAISTLLTLQSHSDPNVRYFTAEALRRLGWTAKEA